MASAGGGFWRGETWLSRLSGQENRGFEADLSVFGVVWGPRLASAVGTLQVGWLWRTRFPCNQKNKNLSDQRFCKTGIYGFRWSEGVLVFFVVIFRGVVSSWLI